MIVLTVDGVAGEQRAHARSRSGGELSNNKGINKQGGGLDRAGADRQGHGRHQDRGGASRPTTSR
jgi:pyruvate kinase